MTREFSVITTLEAQQYEVTYTTESLSSARIARTARVVAMTTGYIDTLYVRVASLLPLYV